MDVHVRSTTDDAQLSYTLSGRGEVTAQDGTDAEIQQNGGQFTVGGTVVDTHSFTVEGGDLQNFEQTGGDSDWVLVVDGEAVWFGGPQPSLTDGFAYATKQQIRSYVECMTEDLTDEQRVREIVADEQSDPLTRQEVRQIVEETMPSTVNEQTVREIIAERLSRFTGGEDGDGEPEDGDSPGEGGWTPLPSSVWDERSRTRIPDGGGALAIWSTGDGDLRYHVEGVGRADYFDDPNQSKLAGLPNNDSVLTRADGTFELEGYTGNGYGDSFLIDGYVTSFEVRDGDSPWRLESMGDVDVLAQYGGPTEGNE